MVDSPGFCLASTLADGKNADELMDGIDTLSATNSKVIAPASLHFDVDDKF